VVVVNMCASVFIYAATVQGYDNSWLQSVNGLDPQFASETEVCSCTVQVPIRHVRTTYCRVSQ
jgi:hypothetical protein